MPSSRLPWRRALGLGVLLISKKNDVRSLRVLRVALLVVGCSACGAGISSDPLAKDEPNGGAQSRPPSEAQAGAGFRLLHGHIATLSSEGPANGVSPKRQTLSINRRLCRGSICVSGAIR
jgi:hypothetical protein